VSILHFEGIPTASDTFFASLKAAIIEAANTAIGAESGEISGFTRTMQASGCSTSPALLMTGGIWFLAQEEICWRWPS
jgi:Na+-translocating ferredoxin:NAD+ oxidoreductase RnfD subunit